MFSILITLYYAFYLVLLHLFLFSYLFHSSICANKIFPPVVFYSVLSFAGDDGLGRCWKDLQIKNFCKGFWQKLLWEVWHRSLVYIQASIIKGHNRVGKKSNSGCGAVFQMLASPFYTNYPLVLECALTRFRHTHTHAARLRNCLFMPKFFHVPFVTLNYFLLLPQRSGRLIRLPKSHAIFNTYCQTSESDWSW